MLTHFQLCLQYMWVMPSSSARCAQLPRAADKVPFYVALKKFRDYLNGVIPHIEESECVFADPKNSKAIYGEFFQTNKCKLTVNSSFLFFFPYIIQIQKEIKWIN